MKAPSSALLLVDGRDERAVAEARAIATWLRARSIAVARLDVAKAPRRVPSAELAIVLGGDGTFLRAAFAIGDRPIPLIGVRLGTFGYLAELEPGDWEAGLSRLVEGRGHVEKWMRLRCRVRPPRGKAREIGIALNEVVVTAAHVARLVEVNVRIDDEDVTRFRGDGLIVASPVGSTAHSLAAGGPIVDRTDRCLLLTPLNSQGLTYRPLVLQAGRTVEMTVLHARQGTALTIDGRATDDLTVGSVVEVADAGQDLLCASVVERSRFRTIRERLGWGAPLVAREVAPIDRPLPGGAASKRPG